MFLKLNTGYVDEVVQKPCGDLRSTYPATIHMAIALNSRGATIRAELPSDHIEPSCGLLVL